MTGAGADGTMREKHRNLADICCTNNSGTETFNNVLLYASIKLTTNLHTHQKSEFYKESTDSTFSETFKVLTVTDYRYAIQVQGIFFKTCRLVYN